MDPKYYKTNSTAFLATTTSSQKNGFIQIRSVSYNKEEKSIPKHQTAVSEIFDPLSYERSNMATKYHWIRKPPFSKSLRKMRQNYHTFYSEFKKEDLIRSDKIPELNNWNKRVSTDIKKMPFTLCRTRPAPTPIANSKVDVEGRFSKTFGYQSATCFRNREEYDTATEKIWKMENPENKERDPYFLNFIRDEHIDAMPAYKTQKIEMMSSHFEPTRTDSVLPEVEIRKSYAWQMIEKPEEYENPNATIGIFEKPWAGIELIMDYIKSLRKECDDQRKIKEDLRNEMKQYEVEISTKLDATNRNIVKHIQKFWKLIRIDFLNHQSKKMDFHKKIQVYKKYKGELIEEIRTERERILQIEDELFKCEMFKMKEPSDPSRNKKNYHRRILRKQQSVLPDYNDIVELDIDSVTLKEVNEASKRKS